MGESESSTSAFFDGFTWALPQAFAGPVAACRFEQGDVLYPTQSAYAAPGKGRKSSARPSGWALQVRAPARSARSAASDKEGASRRSANWVDEVELDLIDLSSGQTKRLETTQGRLWTLLWKGPRTNFEQVLTDASAPPDEPLGARMLQAQLVDGLPALAAVPAAELGAGQKPGQAQGKGRRGGASGIRFVLVVDQASDASRAKLALVEDHLRPLGDCRRLDWSPAEAKVEQADHYSPTLVLRVFQVVGTTVEAAEAALKTALYRGGQNERGASPADKTQDAAAAAPSKNDEEPVAGSADRFSVARHGLLTAFD